MIHWYQIRSRHNSKPGISEAGFLQGLLVMLLLLLDIEALLVAVSYIEWVLQATYLRPWLTRS